LQKAAPPIFQGFPRPFDFPPFSLTKLLCSHSLLQQIFLKSELNTASISTDTSYTVAHYSNPARPKLHQHNLSTTRLLSSTFFCTRLETPPNCTTKSKAPDLLFRRQSSAALLARLRLARLGCAASRLCAPLHRVPLLLRVVSSPSLVVR
jgi:hypothetical protein